MKQLTPLQGNSVNSETISVINQNFDVLNDRIHNLQNTVTFLGTVKIIDSASFGYQIEGNSESNNLPISFEDAVNNFLNNHWSLLGNYNGVIITSVPSDQGSTRTLTSAAITIVQKGEGNQSTDEVEIGDIINYLGLTYQITKVTNGDLASFSGEGIRVYNYPLDLGYNGVLAGDILLKLPIDQVVRIEGPKAGGFAWSYDEATGTLSNEYLGDKAALSNAQLGNINLTAVYPSNLVSVFGTIDEITVSTISINVNGTLINFTRDDATDIHYYTQVSSAVGDEIVFPYNTTACVIKDNAHYARVVGVKI